MWLKSRNDVQGVITLAHYVQLLGRCCCPLNSDCSANPGAGLAPPGCLVFFYLSEHSRSKLFIFLVKPMPPFKKPFVCPIMAIGEGNVTRSSILAWGHPRDRGAWQATVHVVARVEHNLATKPPAPVSAFCTANSPKLVFPPTVAPQLP